MRNYFFFLIVFFCFLTTKSQESDLKNFLRYSFPYNLTSSQNHGAIAWVENQEGKRNLYWAKAPDYSPIKLTAYEVEDGQNLNDLKFSQDLSRLYFVRGSSPNRSGENPNPNSDPNGASQKIGTVELNSKKVLDLGQGYSPIPIDTKIIFIKKGVAWQMDLDGSNATELFKARGTVGSFRLSPDRTKLAFVSQRGDHSFLGIYTISDGTLQWVSPSIDSDSDPVWSPDGSKIAFLRVPFEKLELFAPKRSGLPFSIWLTDTNTGETSKLFEAEEGTGSVYNAINAENQLFWTAKGEIIFPYEKNGWRQLYAVKAASKEVSPLDLGPYEVQYVSQSPDRQQVFFNSNQDDIDRQHIWSYNGTVKQHTKGKSIEWSPLMDGAGNLFCLASNAVTPAHVQRLQEGKAVAVTKEATYPSGLLVAPEQVIFTAADGIKIHAQLFRPKQLKQDGKAPGILFFHGGSRRQMLLGFHHRDYYHYTYAMNQFLASKGYAVLSVNYRSGTGYGMEFREAVNYGATGASEYQDVLAGATYLKSLKEVDADKLGLWGGSYGGYLTAMALARNSDIFKAGVDIHGVYDWNNVIKGFVPSYNKLEVPDFAKLAYDSSPIAFMDGWKSPVLLIHADDDRNVPFNETVLKAQKLRELKVEFEQLVFPDDVHGFLMHSNWLSLFEAAGNFFDRKLK